MKAQNEVETEGEYGGSGAAEGANTHILEDLFIFLFEDRRQDANVLCAL